MTSTTSYLEQYLDSLENLPSELKKNFTNMHELDARNKDILVEIDTASDDYLRAVRDLSPPKRKAEMEKIQVKILSTGGEQNMKENKVYFILKLFWRET